MYDALAANATNNSKQVESKNFFIFFFCIRVNLQSKQLSSSVNDYKRFVKLGKCWKKIHLDYFLKNINENDLSRM